MAKKINTLQANVEKDSLAVQRFSLTDFYDERLIRRMVVDHGNGVLSKLEYIADPLFGEISDAEFCELMKESKQRKIWTESKTLN